MKETPKKRIDPLSSIAILVVLVIIGVNIWNNKMSRPKTESPSSIPDTHTSEEAPGKTVASDFVSPLEFKETARAEQTINTTQGKTNATGDLEQIVYGVVADPNTPNTYYFATSSNNPDHNFTGIYRYNTTTRQWNRLFKHTYEASSGNVTRLHVVGIEEHDLIVTEDHLGDLLDPCTSPLLISPGLYTLSLTQANDGLKKFTLSPAAKSTEEGKEAACKAK